MPRVRSAAEEGALQTPNFKTYYEVWVGEESIGSLVGDRDYDPFMHGRIEASVGQPVQSADFTFHLGKGSRSLSPFLSTGIRSGGRAVIRPGGRVTLRTACVAPGVVPGLSNFRAVFTGRIDSYDMDAAQETITVRCRDIFSEYQDYQIDHLSQTDQGYIYGFPVAAARVDVAMQQVADLALGVAGGLTFQVQGTPGLAIGAYWQEYMGLLEAMRRLGTITTGWDLRGMWDAVAIDQFSLVYYNPDRAKALSEVRGIDRYYALKINSSLINARNVGDVIPANDLRVPQRASNAASIDEYGRRHAWMSEDKSSHIDTDGEALTLAQIMVSDLSGAPVDLVVDTPYNWTWQINDLFQLAPDGFSYDAAHIFAVSSIVHTFAESGDAMTSLGGSATLRAAVREWTDGRKRRNQVRLGEPAGPGFEGDTWYIVDDLTIPTVI